MSNTELNNKAQELRELLHMAEELNAEIEALKDSFKNYMDNTGVDALNGFNWAISYKPVKTSRLDTATLKKLYPEICEAHTIKSSSKRFTFK